MNIFYEARRCPLCAGAIDPDDDETHIWVDDDQYDVHADCCIGSGRCPDHLPVESED